MERQKDFSNRQKQQKTSLYIVWLPFCIGCIWKWKEEKSLAFMYIMCLQGGERLVSHLILPWMLQAALLCNSWADSAKALGVMLLSQNSILCLGMARRANLSTRMLSCGAEQWPTKFSVSNFLIQMVTRDADLSLPAEGLYLTHKMDIFDFAGDLVWRSDLTAELLSDFSINGQYLLGLWISGSQLHPEVVVKGPIQSMPTFHSKYSLLLSVGVLGLFSEARSYAHNQIRNWSLQGDETVDWCYCNDSTPVRPAGLCI